MTPDRDVPPPTWDEFKALDRRVKELEQQVRDLLWAARWEEAKSR